MVVFEVSLNGKKVCIAGLTGHGVISTIISRVTTSKADLKKVPPQFQSERVEPQMGISVGGLSTDGKQKDCFRRWAQEPLAVGDEVVIKIIEAKKADKSTLSEMPNRKAPSIANKKKQARRLCAELGWRVVEPPTRIGSKLKKSPKK